MRATLLLALLVVGACGGSDSTGPAPTYSMAGTWTIPISVTGTILQGGATFYPSCTGSIAAAVTDVSGVLAGTSTGQLDCPIGQNIWTYPLDGTVSGTRDGQAVTMAAGVCQYSGTMTAAKAANGTILCDWVIPNVGTNHFTGTWNANR